MGTAPFRLPARQQWIPLLPNSQLHLQPRLPCNSAILLLPRICCQCLIVCVWLCARLALDCVSVRHTLLFCSGIFRPSLTCRQISTVSLPTTILCSSTHQSVHLDRCSSTPSLPCNIVCQQPRSSTKTPVRTVHFSPALQQFNLLLQFLQSISSTQFYPSTHSPTPPRPRQFRRKTQQFRSKTQFQFQIMRKLHSGTCAQTEMDDRDRQLDQQRRRMDRPIDRSINISI